MRSELGPVVAANVPRSATLAGEPVKHVDSVVGGDAGRDVHLQRLAGELLDDVEQLDHLAVDGLVELEVDRPHVTRPLSPEPVRRNRGFPEPLALAAPPRDSEALLAPDSLHSLAIHGPAQLKQPCVRAPVPPPRSLPGDLAQRSAQRLIVAGDDRHTTLRGSVLTHHPACPALADTETVAQHHDRSAPAGWAHQFPREISLSAWFSST